MEEVVNSLLGVITEVLVLVIGGIGVSVANKVRIHFATKIKKDQLGIVDLVTDRMVEFAEAELTGAKGTEKRAFAVKKVVEALNQKGITVTEDEILAGIENGVNKLKREQIIELDAESIVADGLQVK